MDLATKGNLVDALVETLIVKAKDANGKRLFTDADRVKLLNEADPAVIIKIAGAINNAKLNITAEDAAKE